MLIFLTGFMGAGKSSTGKKLAQLLNVPFTDTDELIEQRTGMTIAEIFERFGEAYFRNLEMEAIAALKNEDMVVACGGGLPCYNDLMTELLSKGKVVYLKTSVGKLKSRLEKSKKDRPLLKGQDLHVYITSKLEERENVYLKAGIIVSTDFKSTAEVVKEISGMI